MAPRLGCAITDSSRATGLLLRAESTSLIVALRADAVLCRQSQGRRRLAPKSDPPVTSRRVGQQECNTARSASPLSFGDHGDDAFRPPLPSGCAVSQGESVVARLVRVCCNVGGRPQPYPRGSLVRFVASRLCDTAYLSEGTYHHTDACAIGRTITSLLGDRLCRVERRIIRLRSAKGASGNGDHFLGPNTI